MPRGDPRNSIIERYLTSYLIVALHFNLGSERNADDLTLVIEALRYAQLCERLLQWSSSS